MGHGVRSLLRKFRAARTLATNKINNINEHTDHNEIVSQVVITIREDIKSSKASTTLLRSISDSSNLCTIYRVPHNLRNVHKSAFDPKLVSIGPFHHGKSHLKAMEIHKLQFLSRLLGGSKTANKEDGYSVVDESSNVLKRLACAMKDLEAEARTRYSETFNKIGTKEFVQMMIRDGCFVIELLRLFAKGGKEYIDDPIFSTRWMVPNLQHDLLLFENQLPLTVLEKILEITSSEKEENLSLKDLALKFFDPLMPRQKKDNYKYNKKPDHLLGLFHDSFVSSLKDRKKLSNTRSNRDNKKSASIRSADFENDLDEPQVKCEPVQLIHCVTELQEAGLKFKRRDNRELLDIKFEKGVLEIPPLLIDDQTGPVFLNFLAYEQCDGYLKPYFTHYVLFFDSLINSCKDVEILHYKDIIRHSLGSDEEVAELFNKLCKEIVHEVDNCYLSQELEDINTFYGTKWHQWKAELTHVYFKNPWTVFSVFAATTVLILTTIQTVLAIASHVYPPSK